MGIADASTARPALHSISVIPLCSRLVSTNGVTCAFLSLMHALGRPTAVAISRKPLMLQLTQTCPCSVVER